MIRQLPLRARVLTRVLCSSASQSQSSPCFSLKNVTRSNFELSLEELKRHVRGSDFVAIDLEMTGITSAPWREAFEFDRSDVRYMKVKDSAEKFAVVQFGVCPFRWDSDKQSFVAQPHNFYIYPRKELPVDGPAYEFLCQTTSIDFLAKYQFDFNACIHEGVSYLSRGQEDEAWKCMNLAYEDEFSDAWHRSKEVRDIPLVSMADILFTERMKCRFKEWRDGLLRGLNGGSQSQWGSHGSSQQFETIFFKMRPALVLDGFTLHQLKLIQLVTRKEFSDLVYIRLNGDRSCPQQLIVYTDSKDTDRLMKEVKDDLRKEKAKKIRDAAGFRHVIDLLSSEKKLIVGHNCFLDIAHIYSKFLHPLPSTAKEFGSAVHQYFPCIIDTKVLLNANNMLQHLMKKGSTSLSKAFALLCPQIASNCTNSGLAFKPCVRVEVEVDDFRSSNWNSGAKHEAGYDAFMTGCVFAQACSHLGVDFKNHSPSSSLAHNEKLQKHINHLYLSWTNGEIIDLTTGTCTAEPSTSHNTKRRRYPEILFSNIVLLWGFPTALKAREIRECISKVFGPLSVTSVYHLDDTAVFVHFRKSESVSEFLLLKKTLEKNNDVITVLHPLYRILEGGNTRAANYEVYKEICSSPISKVSFAGQAGALGFTWKTKLVEPEEVRNKDELLCKENRPAEVSSDAAGKGESTGFFRDGNTDSLYGDERILTRKQILSGM